jgi:hypothetical protein
LVRSLLVGLIVFAAVLAGAQFLLLPFICGPDAAANLRLNYCTPQGTFDLPTLALAYFGAVGLGLIAALLVRREPVPVVIAPAAVVVEPAAIVAPEAMPASIQPEAAIVTPAVADGGAPAPAPAAPDAVAAALAAETPAAELPATPAAPLEPDYVEFAVGFRELAVQGGNEAAERMLGQVDEIALSAINAGLDPKRQLSRLAEIVVREDPTLQSELARQTVTHISLRLQELGVDLVPQPAARTA